MLFIEFRSTMKIAHFTIFTILFLHGHPEVTVFVFRIRNVTVFIISMLPLPKLILTNFWE